MNLIESMDTWRGRAEKAEAELERLKAYCERLASVNASLTNKLQSVLAREAEMRVALRKCYNAMDWAKGNPDGLRRVTEERSRYDKACKLAQVILSSTAGTGYVRKEDVVPLVEALKPFAECDPNICTAHVDAAVEALAHARTLGLLA